MTELVLEDAQTLADLRTLVGRARALDPGGAIRLQAMRATLAVWVGVVPGQGLAQEGLVLGMRAQRLAVPSTVDVAVPLAALSDRFARLSPDDRALPVPPMTVDPVWMAVSPPRGGWSPVASVPVRDLLAVAEAGLAEIAAGAAPAGVWSRALVDDTLGSDASGAPAPLTAGMAHAAVALGFDSGAEAVGLLRAGRWRRLSLPGGHVVGRI